MIYNVVLVSGVQQSESVIYVHISTLFRFFSHIGHYRVVSRSLLTSVIQLVLISYLFYISVQFNSVAQLCPTLSDSMDCSMPGFLVHHQLPELIQTHVLRVIQPSHPLLSPSPPAFNLSQHQGLFK